MFVGGAETRRIHLFLEGGTPGGRIVPGRDNAVLIHEHTPEFGLMVVREGRNCVCCPEERLLCLCGINGHNTPPHIQYSTIWGSCQEVLKKFGEGECNKKRAPEDALSHRRTNALSMMRLTRYLAMHRCPHKHCLEGRRFTYWQCSLQRHVPTLLMNYTIFRHYAV